MRDFSEIMCNVMRQGGREDASSAVISGDDVASDGKIYKKKDNRTQRETGAPHGKNVI